MADPVPATEIRRHFNRVLRRVAAGERVVVESYGRAVVVLVSPQDAALLAAIEQFIVARGLRPDDGAEQADWGAVFPDLQTLDL